MFNLSADHCLQPVLQSDAAHCRQQLPPTYVLNGALYLASREFLIREQALINKDTIGYVMPADRSVDIDNLMDWRYGEFLMANSSCSGNIEPPVNPIIGAPK